MHIEIIKGGVSPLKAKRQASRGGKHAGKATAKKGGYLKGRGGYSKSKGERGAGGRNVGGYNIHTRFSPRKTPTFPGGTGSSDSTKSSGPQKPYSFDEKGDIVITVNPEFNYSPSNVFNPENNPTNINTNTSNVEKENKEIEKENLEYLYRIEQDPDSTVTDKESSSLFVNIWKRKGSKYSSSGQSKRMSDEHFNTLNLKHGSHNKGGNVIHNSYKGYVEYMTHANEWHKTEEGSSWEEKNLTKSRKNEKTTTRTIKGQKYEVKYYLDNNNKEVVVSKRAI